MVVGRTHRPVIKPERCGTCDVCAGGCPASLLRECLDEKDSLRSALFADKRAARLLKGHAVPPCQVACPVRQETRRYLGLIAEGRFLDALDVIRETLPFPGIIGRICHHPCEQACLRGECPDEPLLLCGLKRFVADYEVGRRDPPPPAVGSDRGKAVAIIGAGPSGMACALALRQNGYRVTLYEKERSLGGALYWGIPSYRLPREVLRRETAGIGQAGIEVRLETVVGRDIAVKQLYEAFDALYIACGAQGAARLGIENEFSRGVLSGVDFLRRLNTEGSVDVAGNVVVIGGGNVAIDAAISAGRTGAHQVTVACLESRDQMPADPQEIRQAIAEGVRIEYRWGPHRILADQGQVTAIAKCRSRIAQKQSFRPVAGRR